MWLCYIQKTIPYTGIGVGRGPPEEKDKIKITCDVKVIVNDQCFSALRSHLSLPKHFRPHGSQIAARFVIQDVGFHGWNI